MTAWIYGSAYVVLAIAAVITVLAVERGPSVLDRAVAVDVFTTVVIGAVATFMATTGRTDIAVLLVILALVGFMSSTFVARFVSRESDEDARILTEEEAAKVDEARQRLEEAALRAERERGGVVEMQEYEGDDDPFVVTELAAIQSILEQERSDDLEGVDLDDEDRPQEG